MNRARTAFSLASSIVLSLGLAGASASAATVTLGPNIESAPLKLADLGAATCTTAPREAAIDGNPYFEMPDAAVAEGIDGVAAVQIDLRSDGTLRRAHIAQTSGSYWLDSAAMRTARLTKYKPEFRDCMNVPGSYLLSVVFTP